jgi:diguanylate cyclase
MSITRLLSSTFLLVLIVISMTAYASQADLIVLEDQDSSILLTGKFSWFEDESAALTIEDVSSPAYFDRFTTSDKDNLSFGYTSSAIWLKFKIQDNSDDGRRWLLNLDYPLLDQIDIYQATDDGRWLLQVMGDTFPFNERPILHRTFVTALDLDNRHINTYYIRIITKSSMLIRPTLQSAQRFFEHQSQLQVFFGVMYGFMMMMALYNAFLYIAVRDQTYLVYVISVIAGGVFIASLNGHGYQFLWPNSPGFANMAVPLTSSIWIVATALFSQLFIETKRYTPIFYKLINVMIGLGVIAVLLALFADYQTAIRFGTAMGLVNGLLILTTGIVSWYRGNRAARFFTLAWVVYGFGSTTLVLSRFGVIEDNFITHHSVTLGLLVEIVMLSLALSDKYRVLSKQLEGYTRNLEQKIAERTRDLSKANKALKRLSQQDALTGLPNRREFDRVLNEEWKRHYRNKDSLSLLICDIDNFKEMNDHFGHDVGDESLRKFGQVIKASMHRTTDHPSRIGGDEFAVVLPETDLAGAAKLADDICENIRKLGITHAPLAAHDVVTASIGVATLVPESENNSIILFRKADKALYTAKQQGRDQAAIAE